VVAEFAVLAYHAGAVGHAGSGGVAIRDMRKEKQCRRRSSPTKEERIPHTQRLLEEDIASRFRV